MNSSLPTSQKAREGQYHAELVFFPHSDSGVRAFFLTGAFSLTIREKASAPLFIFYISAVKKTKKSHVS